MEFFLRMHPESDEAENIPGILSNIPMKYTIFLFAFLVSLSSFSPKDSSIIKTVKISGKITMTSSYCGGAAPPQELLNELATPRPVAGMKLYVRKGSSNSNGPVVAADTTAADGSFSFDLPPGTYCILSEEQLKPLDAKDISKEPYVVVTSEECLKKWWSEGLRILEVGDKNIKDVDFQFYGRCFISSLCPCLRYDGPLPP